MTFKASDLSVLAYANNFTLWHYTSADTAETIGGSGYFDKASDMLCKNDLLIVNSDTEGKPVSAFYVVISNKDGNVAVSPHR